MGGRRCIGCSFTEFPSSTHYMAGHCFLCCNICPSLVYKTGKTIRISEKVDNIHQTGMAVVNGQEWTVRSEDDKEILEPETLAKVINISGVKLIVKKYEEE